jgi:uncharacterized membrane protein YfcA
MLAVCFTAIGVIIYWWRATRGSWMDWPAGQSLMGLLAIIAVISGWAGLNTFVLPPRYEWKIFSYFVLYGVLELSLLWIGRTIRNEMRRGKARQVKKKVPATGPVTVVVATENKEKELPDDE